MYDHKNAMQDQDLLGYLDTPGRDRMGFTKEEREHILAAARVREAEKIKRESRTFSEFSTSFLVALAAGLGLIFKVIDGNSYFFDDLGITGVYVFVLAGVIVFGLKPFLAPGLTWLARKDWGGIALKIFAWTMYGAIIFMVVVFAAAIIFSEL